MNKKLIVISIFLPILLISCSPDGHYDSTVSNESQKTVTFIFNGSSTNTLAPDETISYQTKKGERFTGVTNVDAGSPYGFGFSILMVSMNTQSGINYTFKHNEPYDLNVENKSARNVTIKAGDFIYNSGQPTLTINSNSTSTAKIYTRTPKFTLESDPIPVTFNMSFNNNTVYLVIH